MAPIMVSPAVVTDKFRARYRRHVGDWLCSIPSEPFTAPLHPPTLKSAVADPDAVREFIRSWQSAEASFPDGVSLQWVRRDWRRGGLGHQAVPERITIDGGIHAFTAFCGVSEEWHALRRSFRLLLDHLTTSNESDADATQSAIRKTVARTYQRWQSLSDEELEWTAGLAVWFRDHPDSGLLPRAVAVPRVHGKWLESHRGLIENLVSGLRGDPTGASGELGLRSLEPVIRMRMLDPALKVGGVVSDVSMPLSEAAALPLAGTRVVVIIENLETFLSLPESTRGSGLIAIWGAGYAVENLIRLPLWSIKDVPRIICWFDLDADGFGILNLVRASLGNTCLVESLLMDSDAVDKWNHLGTPDAHPTRRAYPYLTAAEATALNALVLRGDLRIEQEKIPWKDVLNALAPLYKELAAGSPTLRGSGPVESSPA